MSRREMICIVCPQGCRLTVIEDNTSKENYEVIGNKCPRGKVYGIEEMTNPTRMLPTTVAIGKAFIKRLPVRTEYPIPKAMIADCMTIINRVAVEAPVKMGDIIIQNILNTGVNIIATRDMDKILEL
ncbi:MAG: DUF1667 domain-containing protein [Clostridiales bacterium]|nr:DUF1667 domain-containing protein [Clostridiales bacterium]